MHWRERQALIEQAADWGQAMAADDERDGEYGMVDRLRSADFASDMVDSGAFDSDPMPKPKRTEAAPTKPKRKRRKD